MDAFINAMETKRANVTENGAIGFATSGHALVDFNFKLPSYRTEKNSRKIFHEFMKAYNEYPELTLRYLYMLRDIRGGIGERNTFRVVLTEFLNDFDNNKGPLDISAEHLLDIIPLFGRCDDLIYIYKNCIDNNIKDIIIKIINVNLIDDRRNLQTEGKPVSLLGKWLPSVQCADRKTALELARRLHLKESEYRKLLSRLRKRIDIVERHMSANNWSDIKYENVPSKASMIYANAFNEHDSERYNDYLADVANGKAKMNAKVLFPHEIVHKYNNYDEENSSLELLWKNLNQIEIGNKKIITVCDVSGSMYGNPMDMSYGLGIYFSEHLTGEYKDKAILFSQDPVYIDFSTDKSLFDKLTRIADYIDCSNTDIEETFRLILNTAVINHLKPEELPDAVLVISDMEFDDLSYTPDVQTTLFDGIKQMYEQNGYKLPKLIFWNVSSRTNTVPIQENENGVILISGFSTNIVKMVISNKLDPWEVLKEMILDKRYDIVLAG